MKDPIKTKDSLTSVHFESLVDFMQYQYPKDNVNRYNWRLYREGTDTDHKPDWYGPTNNCSVQTLEKALAGDPELGKTIQSMWAQLDQATGKKLVSYEQQIQVSKRRRIRSDFGDELDIHKVYQGQLDRAWSRTERVVIDSKHTLVTLFVDIGGNVGVDAVDALWRAVTTTRLVSELEAAGKSVKVVVGGSSSGALTGTGLLTTVSVVVKNYNQPLSLERLAAMTHLGFYRSFGFAAKMIFRQRVAPNLGHSISIANNVPVQLQEEVDEGHTRFVHIDRASSLQGAVTQLESAYEQMEKFSKEQM